MIKDKVDQKTKEDGYKIHAYNILISNRLPLDRDLPDTRNPLCKSKTYEADLPKASVVICFYNEHFQTLLRTIHSILNITASELLEEILLIDDYSDAKNLYADVEKYMKEHSLPKVKLMKTERREGLIRARLIGARKATGKVLVFLDSHIEVNIDWLRPLLQRIKEKKTNVVMPIIDIINPDTFEYTASPLVRGGFNWGLHFKWENLPKHTLVTKDDFVKPIKSPTMAGGLFAIDKSYFVDIGEYDAGMNIWGGENLELSFRIWMCGGSLELIPCSRVGHIFRHRRPYGSPDGEDTMLHNSLRVAYVWMDEYKDFFLNQRPESRKIDYGDISSRIQLRKELKCFDFDWYLKNVYPELALPTDDEARLKKKWSQVEQDKYQPWHSRKRNYVDQYQIQLVNSSLCIQSAKDVKTKGSRLKLLPCKKSKAQSWSETDKSELVLAQLLCLQSGKVAPILYKCHEMGGDQEWKHKGGKNTPIYNLAAGMCLAAQRRVVNAAVVMNLCTDSNGLSNWNLVP
ncbi:unnamed protein product [Acanthoscelides obtectus]|uniref:Polypeptide N-acetylgalactosaminyltransferase n=1 Tax=Acanthoscelides obtectus TaxID=200917 RepID=A0A9P0Q9C7_ACAOB|nr:unnamed protein product [Acanthoscelides obtectus]CAK1622024.1 Polypeptide N-acetylgalactosaminyltransferase 35A [Acanthoscelides obtectus]